MTLKTWESIATKKCAEREKALQRDLSNQLSKNCDTELIHKITSIDSISELASKIALKEYTSLQVVSAYINKIIDAQDKTNCLTEPLFEHAKNRSIYLDEYYENRKKNNIHPFVKGPLHGIPFTVKDQFNFEGVDTTLGYNSRAFKPAQNTATLIKILEDLGAIVIAKTNLPQTILIPDTVNFVFGRTTHPFNKSLSPGGSTGGEAALLALNSTILGWGTDIGGSIRMPSAAVGTYGLRTTSGRMPYRNTPVTMQGEEHIPSVIGPMTRSLESLTYISKLLIQSNPSEYDPKCIPIPWNSLAYENVLLANKTSSSKNLSFAVILDDSTVHVHPPISRALEDLITALKSAGHDVLPWTKAPEQLHDEILNVQAMYYVADNSQEIRNDVESTGEPMLPRTKFLIESGLKSPVMSISQYYNLNSRKLDLQEKYLDIWNETASQTSNGKRVDFIISPVLPHVAVGHNQTTYVGYTKIWNFLDYPAISFPVSKVDKNIDSPVLNYTPRNNPEDLHVASLYNLENMHGLPINLQLIARRYEEEKLLAGTKVIQDVLKKYNRDKSL